MTLFKSRIYCPVCAAFLGDRFKEEAFIAHCEECRCTYTWKRKEDKPIPALDKDKPDRCNCGGCKR